MISPSLRRALTRMIDQSAIPALGGVAGATGGAALSDNDASGAIGGAMIGGMAGYGARRLLTQAAQRAFRPELPLSLRVHERARGAARDPEAQAMSRVQRRVADFMAPLARRTSETLEELNTLEGMPPASMGEVLMAGRAADEGFFRRRLRNYDARNDIDEETAGSTLFGGAPFDPARMRRAAGLAPLDETSRSLPTNPHDWQALARRYPGMKEKEARAIIMYSAKARDGRPKFQTEDILRQTGYGSYNSLKQVAAAARKRGIPVPSRPKSTKFHELPFHERKRLAALAAERAARLEAKAAERGAAAVAKQERVVNDAELALARDALGVSKIYRMSRGSYDESDLINEALTLNEQGFYPRRADISASLRDDEGQGANLVGVQLDRLLKYADLAVKGGDQTVNILAKIWNVTPDKVRLLAQRPWQGNRASGRKYVDRLIESGTTDPKKLMHELRSEPSLRHMGDNSIEQTVYAALRAAGRGKPNRRSRNRDALSILLPYLVTGGVGTAISTVADREARRNAILREMSI